MMRPALGDVVVRARGLANHLLDRMTLHQLAHSSGSGVLAGALEDVGYWPAPSAAGPAPSAARVVERTIEHETLARLSVLARWLGERMALFVALFEHETRETLRIRLRELLAGSGRVSALAEIRGGWPDLREVRAVVARAADVPGLVRELTRQGSPYAAPLSASLREHGDDPFALEATLDRTWAERARTASARLGGALLGFVEDEIDLRNAWGALAGAGQLFVEGGRALPRALHDAIAAEADEPVRRRRLARAFHGGSLQGVFDDPDAGLEVLEARARSARIVGARRAARLDPIGASPILEVVLRLRAERADLRCIGFGVATGLAHETIVDRLAGAP